MVEYRLDIFGRLGEPRTILWGFKEKALESLLPLCLEFALVLLLVQAVFFAGSIESIIWISATQAHSLRGKKSTEEKAACIVY